MPAVNILPLSCCQLFEGESYVFYVGLVLICCYSCHTGAREKNKALLSEVLGAMWCDY